jgi:hypothetical protein
MLGLIGLIYVRDQSGKSAQLYNYISVSNLNLLCYFSLSRFLVFSVSIIGSVNASPNDLQ